MTTTPNDITVLARPNQSYWTEDYRQFTSIDPAIKNIGFRVEQRFKSGQIKMIHFERIALDDETKPLFASLQEMLDRLHPYMQHSHFFLVERQQPISSQNQVHTNSKVMRVFGHIMGYLLTKYANVGVHPMITEVSPKLKGKMLGFAKDLTYAQTKSTGVKMGIALLTAAEDTTSLAVIKAAGAKKDDLTDTVCQTEAFIRGFYDLNNDKIKFT